MMKVTLSLIKTAASPDNPVCKDGIILHKEFESSNPLGLKENTSGRQV
jgi:hypothetical protein